MVRLRETSNYSKCLGIALESLRIVCLHGLADSLLSVMSKGWVTQIVGKTCSFHDIGMKPSSRFDEITISVIDQSFRDPASDLCHF